jgi:hypothetical protein
LDNAKAYWFKTGRYVKEGLGTDYLPLSTAADEFAKRILPTLRSWLDAQVDKPDTAILGCEELVVEWLGSYHELHRLHYL